MNFSKCELAACLVNIECSKGVCNKLCEYAILDCFMDRGVWISQTNKKNMKILTGPFFLAPLASWCLLSLSSTRIRKPFISYCYECNLRLALRSLKRFAYKRIQAANCCLNSFQQFQPFSCVFRETATSAPD